MKNCTKKLQYNEKNARINFHVLKNHMETVKSIYDQR